MRPPEAAGAPPSAPAADVPPRMGVVIPFANEETTVHAFLALVLARIGEGDRVYCVFDNACRDSTLERVWAAAERDPRVAVLWAPENRCVVDAYFRGYREARDGCGASRGRRRHGDRPFDGPAAGSGR